MDAVGARQGHRQIEHTADLAFELWAPSAELLLLEGASALVEVMTEGARVEADARREVRIDALDAEDRLVQFLNEVVYLAITEGHIVSGGEVHLDGERRMTADLRVKHAPEVLKTEVKSVTYHDLRLVHDETGWRARIVIDV